MSSQETVIAGTASHLQEQMQRTMKHMAGMQGDKPGTRKRSTKEINSITKSIQNLPGEEKQAILEAMAERAGHMDGEERPCEMCKYIGSMAMKKMAE